MPIIEDIRIYPVKGLRGISLREAVVEPWGLAGDRRWMVVDAEGRFVTQREIPRMARLEARPRPSGLELVAEGFDLLHVPWPEQGAPAVPVRIWNDDVAAITAGAAAEAWLTAVLGRACRLVHMADPAEARPVDADYGTAGDRVSFAEGFPVLVTTTASLDDLARRLGRSVAMDRFRSNLVVAGGEPWMEDRWRRIGVGQALFGVVKDCARCIVTTVDQERGETGGDSEPLRTLATFRRKARGRIIFGQNLIPRRLGRIAVGDAVAVLEEAAPL